MSDFDEDEILAVCQEISGAASSADPELRVSPTLREAVVVPALVVTAGEPFITYHQRFGGDEAAYLLDVVFLAAKTNEIAAQRRFYRWVNPKGPVYQAIDAIDGVSAESVVNVGYYDVGTASFWGGTLRVAYSG